MNSHLEIASKVYSQINYYTVTISDSIGKTSLNIDKNDLIFEKPVGVRFDSKENMFVLDSNADCVYKFDKDVKLVKKTGRTGVGPLEFNFEKNVMNAGYLAITSNDNLFVYGLSQYRGQLINNDLDNPLKEIRFSNFVFDVKIGKSGNLYVQSINRIKNAH